MSDPELAISLASSLNFSKWSRTTPSAPPPCRQLCSLALLPLWSDTFTGFVTPYLQGIFLEVQSGVEKGSVEETCLQQQAEVWELVSVLYSHIAGEAPLARRLEGMPLHLHVSVLVE